MASQTSKSLPTGNVSVDRIQNGDPNSVMGVDSLRTHITTGAKPLRVDVLADEPIRLKQDSNTRIAPLHVRRIDVGLRGQDLVENRQVPLRTETGEPTLPISPRTGAAATHEASEPRSAPADARRLQDRTPPVPDGGPERAVHNFGRLVAWT